MFQMNAGLSLLREHPDNTIAPGGLGLVKRIVGTLQGGVDLLIPGGIR
jgi:hypothetical protein